MCKVSGYNVLNLFEFLLQLGLLLSEDEISVKARSPAEPSEFQE